ncbi:zinc finger, c3HC4 type (RING finger) domain-containing protein [Ditylenchus destructor]|uniref:Zinc finger, c3HC4 type (RING finger) domain-containing protein n=1 Tax=Ditylenchus destructor TaxID=166010 RepID=A0AAD4QZB7_9BILA|nr:zinc finger, c3HC4 type (RING finger) domain-containing protein [Ditylenchus destructor]
MPINDIYTTSCGHTFHSQCLHRAFAHSGKCPTCREDLFGTAHRVFLDEGTSTSISSENAELKETIRRLEKELEETTYRHKRKLQAAVKENDELREMASEDAVRHGRELANLEAQMEQLKYENDGLYNLVCSSLII